MMLFTSFFKELCYQLNSELLPGRKIWLKVVLFVNYLFIYTKSCLHVCMCLMYMQFPQGPKEGVRIPRTIVSLLLWVKGNKPKSPLQEEQPSALNSPAWPFPHKSHDYSKKLGIHTKPNKKWSLLDIAVILFLIIQDYTMRNFF